MPSFNAPAVSVIIPVRNSGRYFRECLDSVIGQTLHNIEIIIIDDASTDGSNAVAEAYAAQDSRITVIHHNESTGAGPARNDGMAIAKGEYIAFMDSDDLYPSPDVLYKLYSKAIEKNVNICGGSLVYINEDGTHKTEQLKYQKFLSEGLVYYKDYQYDGGFYRFIYKKCFLQRNNLCFPSNISLEDCIFFVYTMHSSGIFYCIEDTTYLYRKINKNKESSHIFLYKKLKARYLLLKFSFKNEYKILYKAQKNATINDLRYLRVRYIPIYIKNFFQNL